MPNTTADLLSDVKSRVAAPSANGLASDAEILRLADQELRTTIAGVIQAARSEYWVVSETLAIVAGQGDYRIPDRSLANGLHELVVIDPNGREYPVDQVDASDVYVYSQGVSRAWRAPFHFALRGPKIALLPTPTTAFSGWSLKLSYYCRPPQLIPIAQGAPIQQFVYTTGGPGASIPLAENVSPGDVEVYPITNDEFTDDVYAAVLFGSPAVGPFTVEGLIAGKLQVPAGAPANTDPGSGGVWFAGSATVSRIYAASSSVQFDDPPPTSLQEAGARVDVVRGDGLFETLFSNLTIGIYDSTPEPVVYFTELFDTDEIADTTTQTRVDYLVPHGTTVYPPIPDAVYPLFVAAVCRAYCEAIGDVRGYQVADSSYTRKLQDVEAFLAPRVDGSVKRVINRFSALRSR